MTIARATAASAAATVIMKIAKICPVKYPAYGVTLLKREKPTRVILTAFSIISMPINTAMALCLAIAPYKPMQKSTAPSTKKCVSVRPMPLILPANNNRANNSHQQNQRSNFKGQDVTITCWTIQELTDGHNIVDPWRLTGSTGHI